MFICAKCVNTIASRNCLNQIFEQNRPSLLPYMIYALMFILFFWWICWQFLKTTSSGVYIYGLYALHHFQLFSFVYTVTSMLFFLCKLWKCCSVWIFNYTMIRFFFICRDLVVKMTPEFKIMTRTFPKVMYPDFSFEKLCFHRSFIIS